MDFKPGNIIDLEKIHEVIITEGELDVFDFVWRLKNFSEDTSIETLAGSSPKGGPQWNVKVSQKTKNYGIVNYPRHVKVMCIRLKFLHETGRFPFPVKTTCALHFINSEMKVHRGFSYSHDFTKEGEEFELFAEPVDSFMKADEGYVSDDGTLNLFFRVTVHAAEKPDAQGEKSGPVNLAEVDHQYKSILENGEFSDLTVKTKTSSFPVSKVILAGQSPVFRTMFLTDMVESKENVVKIEDFSDETVKGLLEFLYTGHCESLEENADEFLVISEKYQAVNLKRECQHILINKLNVENAAEMFILASSYNAPKLKSQVVAFVKMCRTEVAATESFKQLKKTNSEMLLDLYSSFV